MQRAEHTYIYRTHTRIHTNIQSIRQTFTRTYMHTDTDTQDIYIHAYILAYTYTYIQTQTHSYTPTHLHTYIHTCIHPSLLCFAVHLRSLEEVWEVGVCEVADAPLDPDAVVATWGRGEVLQTNAKEFCRPVPILPFCHLAEVLFCRVQKMLHWFCQIDLTTSRGSGLQIYRIFGIQGFGLRCLATCHPHLVEVVKEEVLSDSTHARPAV